MKTDPEPESVLAELVKREPIFHRPEFGVNRRASENMTDPDFCAVGASGRHYSREYVIDTLVARHSAPRIDVWETSGFSCRARARHLSSDALR